MVNISFSVQCMRACARARKTMYQFEFRSKYALHERKPAKYEIIWAKAYNNDVVCCDVVCCDVVVYVQILELVRAQFDFAFEAEKNDNEIKSGLV